MHPKDKIAQIKEIHKINNELNEQIKNLSSANESLTLKVTARKQEEKQYIDRIRSLEGT